MLNEEKLRKARQWLGERYVLHPSQSVQKLPEALRRQLGVSVLKTPPKK